MRAPQPVTAASASPPEWKGVLPPVTAPVRNYMAWDDASVFVSGILSAKTTPPKKLQDLQRHTQSPPLSTALPSQETRGAGTGRRAGVCIRST